MTPVGDGLDVHFEQIAARIRRSSNFRVAWQLFEWDGLCKASPRTARQVIGEMEGCLECRGHNAHLFSDWFYGVAWDWCYCVIWEARRLVGLLCMTDTD